MSADNPRQMIWLFPVMSMVPQIIAVKGAVICGWPLRCKG